MSTSSSSQSKTVESSAYNAEPLVSFAQNHEDIVLNRIFATKARGVYVDVGAYDPIDCSITKLFYDRGWEGINIEPGSVFGRLQELRPRDINLNIAISSKSGESFFYEHPQDPGTSTLSKDLPESLKHYESQRVCRVVNTRTLSEVLSECEVASIDFMSIDVEGHEREVILGNDWRRFRPTVLIIEATMPYTNIPCHDRWEDIILGEDYVFALFDGINRFYLRKENSDLLEHLRAPVNSLDNFVPAAWVSERSRIQAFADQADEDRKALRQEIERLHQDIERIEAFSSEADSERLALRLELSEIDAQRVRIQAFADQADEDRKALRQEIERLHQDIERIEAFSSEADSERLALRLELSEIDAQRSRIQAFADQADEDRKILRKEAEQLLREIDRLEALWRDTDSERLTLRGDLEHIEADRKRIQDFADQADADRQTLLAEVERLHSEIERIDSFSKQAHAERLHLREEIHGLKDEYARLIAGTGVKSLQIGLAAARSIHGIARRVRRDGSSKPSVAVPVVPNPDDTISELPISPVVQLRGYSGVGVVKRLNAGITWRGRSLFSQISTNARLMKKSLLNRFARAYAVTLQPILDRAVMQLSVNLHGSIVKEIKQANRDIDGMMLAFLKQNQNESILEYRETLERIEDKLSLLETLKTDVMDEVVLMNASRVSETDKLLLSFLKGGVSGASAGSSLGNIREVAEAVAGGDNRILASHPLVGFMYLDARDVIVTPRVVFKSYECGVHKALKALVKPGFSVVEVGANQGFHTLTLAYLAYPTGGRVLTFEPDPRNFSILQDNIRAHGMWSVVTAFQKAAYSRNTNVILNLGVSGSQSNLYRDGGADRIEIEAVSIGDTLREMDIGPDFVRLDCEGAEGSAIQGMWSHVESVPHLKMMFEFCPELIYESKEFTPNELLEKLRSVGMRFWVVEDDGSLASSSVSDLLSIPRGAWKDVLAARDRDWT